MPGPVIETHGLTKTYGDVVAVHDLDLEVPTGSVFGLLGPNGAGKTTIIGTLLGLIRADAGEIRLFGETIDGSIDIPTATLDDRTGRPVEIHLNDLEKYLKHGCLKAGLPEEAWKKRAKIEIFSAQVFAD